jgi:hypothetical protein
MVPRQRFAPAQFSREAGDAGAWAAALPFFFSAFPVTLRCFPAVSNNAEAPRTQENTSEQIPDRDLAAGWVYQLILRSPRSGSNWTRNRRSRQFLTLPPTRSARAGEDCHEHDVVDDR